MPDTVSMKCQWLCLCMSAFVSIVPSCKSSAQTPESIKASTQPLVLSNRGSFFLGGKNVEQTPVQLSSIFGRALEANGHVTVEQMYVEYMIPGKVTGSPVVMLHGGTLTGKGYDTTPDGRMGWYEYFVRQGHPVYIPDQVGRGRSGSDIATYNDVRAGVKSARTLPNAFRESDEYNWKLFRFGPSFGVPFSDEQFPVIAVNEMSKQGVPDLNAALPNPNPNAVLMAELAHRLKRPILMGHSETGELPLEAALMQSGDFGGLILIEPGFCGAIHLSEAQIATLAKIPILIVFGDHLDAPTGAPGFSWKNAYEDCNSLVARLHVSHGEAEMLYPPSLGIYGNSHLLMEDRNNLQIADLILKWINQYVDSGKKQ